MRWMLAPLAALLATAAPAATPRETLTAVAFEAPSKPAALAGINQALAGADAILATTPGDREGQLARFTAIGYRAKLTHSPSDAKTAKRLIEAFVAANPRDPDGQLSLAGWHLDSVDAGFLTASVLGAKKDIGLAAADRAVAMGGDRAFFKGFVALMRVRIDPADPVARTLAEQAAAAPTPTPLDRIAKQDAAALLAPLRAHDGKAAGVLARKLLPMGRL